MSEEKRPNLHELADRFSTLNNALLYFGGLVTEENEEEIAAILAELETAEGDIHDKVDAIRPLIGFNDTQASWYEAEADAHYGRAQAFRSVARRLRDWIITSLEHAGLDRAGRIIPQRIQANGGVPAVEWERIGEPIPRPYQRVKITVELDKDAVLEDWRAGRPLPPGIKVTRGRHLRDENVPRRKGGKRVSRSE